MTDRPTPGQLEQRAPRRARRHRRAPPARRDPLRRESRDLGGWREVIEPGASRMPTCRPRGPGRSRRLAACALPDHAGGRGPRRRAALDVRAAREPRRRARGRRARRPARHLVADDRRKRDEWRGKTRHVREIAELRDVSLVVGPPTATRAPSSARARPDPPRTRATPEPAMPVPDQTPRRAASPRRGPHRPTDRSTPEARIMDAMAGRAARRGARPHARDRRAGRARRPAHRADRQVSARQRGRRLRRAHRRDRLQGT